MTEHSMMQCLEDTVYVVDPDEAVHDALKTLLGTTGTEVSCYANAEEFLDSGVVSDAMRGCLLVEIDLPGMGSLELLRQLRTRGVDTPVVALTSVSDSDMAKQALKAGAVVVIEKPLVSGRLLEQLNNLCCHDNQTGADMRDS
jgi:FixJ family two-component response regulator